MAVTKTKAVKWRAVKWTGGKAPRKQLAVKTQEGTRTSMQRGTVALREVRTRQKTLEFLVRESPLEKLLREIAEAVEARLLRLMG